MLRRQRPRRYSTQSGLPRGEFRHTDDGWDYYLASAFGDVETLERLRTANPPINGPMHNELPLIVAVRNSRPYALAVATAD